MNGLFTVALTQSGIPQDRGRFLLNTDTLQQAVDSSLTATVAMRKSAAAYNEMCSFTAHTTADTPGSNHHISLRATFGSLHSLETMIRTGDFSHTVAHLHFDKLAPNCIPNKCGAVLLVGKMKKKMNFESYEELQDFIEEKCGGLRINVQELQRELRVLQQDSLQKDDCDGRNPSSDEFLDRVYNDRYRQTRLDLSALRKDMSSLPPIDRRVDFVGQLGCTSYEIVETTSSSKSKKKGTKLSLTPPHITPDLLRKFQLIVDGAEPFAEMGGLLKDSKVQTVLAKLQMIDNPAFCADTIDWDKVAETGRVRAVDFWDAHPALLQIPIDHYIEFHSSHRSGGGGENGEDKARRPWQRKIKALWRQEFEKDPQRYESFAKFWHCVELYYEEGQRIRDAKNRALIKEGKKANASNKRRNMMRKLTEKLEKLCAYQVVDWLTSHVNARKKLIEGIDSKEEIEKVLKECGFYDEFRELLLREEYLGIYGSPSGNCKSSEENPLSQSELSQISDPECFEDILDGVQPVALTRAREMGSAFCKNETKTAMLDHVLRRYQCDRVKELNLLYLEMTEAEAGKFNHISLASNALNDFAPERGLLLLLPLLLSTSLSSPDKQEVWDVAVTSVMSAVKADGWILGERFSDRRNFQKVLKDRGSLSLLNNAKKQQEKWDRNSVEDQLLLGRLAKLAIELDKNKNRGEYKSKVVCLSKLMHTYSTFNLSYKPLLILLLTLTGLTDDDKALMDQILAKAKKDEEKVAALEAARAASTDATELSVDDANHPAPKRDPSDDCDTGHKEQEVLDLSKDESSDEEEKEKENVLNRQSHPSSTSVAGRTNVSTSVAGRTNVSTSVGVARAPAKVDAESVKQLLDVAKGLHKKEAIQLLSECNGNADQALDRYYSSLESQQGNAAARPVLETASKSKKTVDDDRKPAATVSNRKKPTSIQSAAAVGKRKKPTPIHPFFNNTKKHKKPTPIHPFFNTTKKHKKT